MVRALVGVCALALAAVAVSALPTAGRAAANTAANVDRLAHLGPEDLAEEWSGQFEGDMVLDEEQLDIVRNKRNGLIAQTRHWPNGIVYYYINEADFTPEQVQHVELGVRLLQTQSCLRFVRVESDAAAYIRVIGSDSGCYSSVGFTGRAQNLNLQPYPRTIVPKDPTATIGQRVGMSEKDISKLNWMYGCLLKG
uniref:Uncharacterized protein n=2 Tax=Anopheles atroparvus TaxID=41427 RepID=A0A182JMN1_ANOAO